MRVLYVNHTSRVSGGERSLLGLLAALPSATSAAVACPEGELAARLRAAGVEVFPIHGTDGSLRLSPIATPRALAEMALAAAQVRRATARFGADVVHANSVRAGLLVAGRRGHRLPRTVVHVRDCLPPGRASGLALRAVAGADLVIANSAYTRERLGPAAARARVVHNAVELDRYPAPLSAPAARARLGLGASAPVLAVVAQITPWKGQDDAVEALAMLGPEQPDAQLLLVGAVKFDSPSTRHDNGAYLRGLQARVAELGLGERVRLLGEREDVPEILAAVDLLLAPSWEEPFGRSIVEAMAAGVPVLATEVGGPAEIVSPGRTGLLLAPRDPRAWAEAIAGLLRDRPRLAALGLRGREEAGRRFGIERHLQAVTAVYEELAPVSGASESSHGPCARIRH
jgi:glycosyltransferase involved in cell wall biosynthesis